MALIDKLKAIGDAIRAKTGKTDEMTLDQMVTEIEGISGGGSEGQTNLLNALIGRSATEITSDAKNIGNYAFYKYSQLTTVDFPLVTNVVGNAFQDCTALTTVDFPSLTKLGPAVFQGCTALTIAYFPLVTGLETFTFYGCSKLATANFPLATKISSYVFRNCIALTTVNFPLVTNILDNAFTGCRKLTTVYFPSLTNLGSGSSAFQDCTALTTVDFPSLTKLGPAVFQGCTALKTLVLRTTSEVCTLSNSNSLSGCTKFTSTKDGYIYVPAALIEDYKVATNWVTYASQFRALEDYTVDGTTTGALDESKI